MKLLIVGGVAGGAAAAARARRLDENAHIVLFERGEHISYASCGLPYYTGGVIQDRQRLLLQTPESFRQRFNVDVRTGCRVLSIDRAARQVEVQDLGSGRVRREPYDFLILSPGAEPVTPNVPGTDLPFVMRLRTVPDADRIRALLDTGRVRRAAVVGGGFIGLEMAETLRARGLEVHLVEKLGQVLPPLDPEMAAGLHRELTRQGVGLHLGEEVRAIRGQTAGGEIETVSGTVIPADLVILAVGVKPETDLASRAGLELGRRGIRTDAQMRTSDPCIFAVGDAAETADPVSGGVRCVPLAGPAARQAWVAVNTIFNVRELYRGTFGTSVLKLFSLTAGLTGAAEKTLRACGHPLEKVYLRPASHAGYYPGAEPMSMKILFDPRTGRLLGAQIVGGEGVDKRLDVLATAVQHNLTVEDLAHLELAYAPPYGSTRDPVNLAGMIALNHLRGLAPLTHWEALTGEEFLLDVRTRPEFERGTARNARNIPVDELRARLAEIPSEKTVAVFCQVGQRAHTACRILLQRGYRAVNVSGGYGAFADFKAAFLDPALPPPPAAAASAAECGCPVPPPSPTANTRKEAQLDVRGLQCPGPILRVKEALEGLPPGQTLRIVADDPGFAADLPGWCQGTGAQLLELTRRDRLTEARVMRSAAPAAATPAPAGPAASTLVVFSDSLDRVMAAFIIALSAAASGRQVTMFFTFWGLNALKRRPAVFTPGKDFISRMFGLMLPSDASRLPLSKLHLGGLGAALMRRVMKLKRVDPVPELLAKARGAGVHLVACSMSMDVMGVQQAELVEGVEIAGAAHYIGKASGANHNLFI